MLYDEGFVRYGWPDEVGGLGGSVLHRAAMWEALARHGVPGMALFEHLEILAPTLVVDVARATSPPSTSRLPLGPGALVPGLLRARTPAPTSPRCARRRCRTATATVISGQQDLDELGGYADVVLRARPHRHHRVAPPRSHRVHRRPELARASRCAAIEQANGTDELAEVVFDDVYVPADRIVGELDGGWRVAMHILSHERGTFAWFRHCFLYQQLIEFGDARSRRARVPPRRRAPRPRRRHGRAAASGLKEHAVGVHPRARARHSPSCCSAPPSSRCRTPSSPATPTSPSVVQDDLTGLLRQEYLFSRIVTVYGGSQQMQLETIAKQVVGLP